MSDKSLKTIFLTVNRQEQMVIVDTIIYAQVTDKLCTIYLAQNKTLKLFLTISALKALLPENQFLMISRNCLISLKHLKNIDAQYVYMDTGSRLPYSQRRKNTLFYTFQELLNTRAKKHPVASLSQPLSAEFAAFDRVPVPFAVLEATAPQTAEHLYFICRYANDSFAKLVSTPGYQLVNVAFRDSDFKYFRPFWYTFTRIAFSGGEETLFQTFSDGPSERTMYIKCYQPHYGFCAVMAFFLPDRKELTSAPVIPLPSGDSSLPQ